MWNNIVCCLRIKLMLQKHKHTQGDDKAQSILRMVTSRGREIRSGGGDKYNCIS